MPAPDFYTLYDFESQIEDAWSEILMGELSTAGIIAQVVTSRDPESKITPRIELSFALGAALEQRTTAGQSSPKQVPNAFAGTLTVLVATTRPIPTDNANIHGQLRGLCRYCLSAAKQAIGDSNLPYLQLLDQLPSSATPQVFDDKEQDLTQMIYAVIFSIRNDAWPAA